MRLSKERQQKLIPMFQPSATKPTTYSPHLTPMLSTLRPHCLARDRLCLWKPPFSHKARDESSRQIGMLSEQDLTRVFEVMAGSWADSTRKAYGSGLLVYHIFCDTRSIPEDQRAPASSVLIAAFIASLAGSHSGSAISNYLYSIRAWHTLHGVKWHLNDTEMAAVLKGADKMAPTSSKRKKRRPYTIQFITAIRSQLNLEEPQDAAVFACLTTCFYAVARVGEFTVPHLDAFDGLTRTDTSQQPTYVLTPIVMASKTEVMVLHIPRTKVAPIEGKDVFWVRQEGLSDPYQALNNHLLVNSPLPPNQHLFAYRFKNGFRALMKHAFLKRLATAARAGGEEPLQGHGICIGATLEFLLRGVPFEAMKVLGQWASDAFTVYL